MVGYGPESSHFVIEVTYNYTVSKYRVGNDLKHIDMWGDIGEILARAKQQDIPS